MEFAPYVDKVLAISQATPSDDAKTVEKDAPEAPEMGEGDAAGTIAAPLEEVPAASSDTSESREVVQESRPVESEAVDVATPVAEVPAVTDAIPSDEMPEVDFEANSAYAETCEAAPTAGH